jgi:hypothetical protein
LEVKPVEGHTGELQGSGYTGTGLMEGLTRLCRYSPRRFWAPSALIGSSTLPAYEYTLERTSAEDPGRRPQWSEQRKAPAARGVRFLIRHQELRHHRRNFWLACFIPTFSNRSRKNRCIARVTPEVPHQFLRLMNSGLAKDPDHFPIEASEACRNKSIVGPVS